MLAGVPGAGSLDIEPLADEREGVVALGAFGLIAVAALAASLQLGGATGGSVGLPPQCDELADSAYGYLQCVSDVFE